MRVDLFDFELPQERIALEPIAPRDASRLLHIGSGGVSDRMIGDLPSLLHPGDLLVSNDTKVIPAQLFGTRASRETGGGDISIDVTLHKKLDDSQWCAFIRPAKRLRAGDVVKFSDELSATVVSREGAEAILDFNLGGQAFQSALNEAGVMPLPPYIARRRKATARDMADYQTMFAATPGSVAAPTAGFHFTDELLESLSASGIQHMSVTLHVGAGTFLPVSVDDTADHKMHAEWGEITQLQADQINQTRRDGGRIIAIGTTSLRLMESAADEDGVVQPYCGETDIFITPGYRFRAVDRLLTNFHLPRSTLFMLVCAFSGTQRMKDAYAHAIKNEYRFYSFGDACFLEPQS